MGGAFSSGKPLVLPQKERLVASRLSAAQGAEKVVEAARIDFRNNKERFRNEPFIDLVDNVNRLGGSISGSHAEHARPQLSSAKLSKARVVSELALNGVSEAELLLLFEQRGSSPSKMPVSELADRFKLNPGDVQLLLQYSNSLSGLTRPNPQVPGQLIAFRRFDPNPSV